MQIDDNGSRQTQQLEGLRELVISNIPSYAAGTLPSPDADFSDRYLDITAFRSIFSFAGLFLVKPLGRLRNRYGTTLPQYGGEKIRLQLAPDNCLQIDGEDKTYLLDDTDTITIDHAGQGLIVQGERYNALDVITLTVDRQQTQPSSENGERITVNMQYSTNHRITINEKCIDLTYPGNPFSSF